jgi:hypothetical protein
LASIIKAACPATPDFLCMKPREDIMTMWLARARWLVAFCGALISPVILIYGLPLAIGAAVDLATVAATVL